MDPEGASSRRNHLETSRPLKKSPLKLRLELSLPRRSPRLRLLPSSTTLPSTHPRQEKPPPRPPKENRLDYRNKFHRPLQLSPRPSPPLSLSSKSRRKRRRRQSRKRTTLRVSEILQPNLESIFNPESVSVPSQTRQK